MQTVKFLTANPIIEVNTLNGYGIKALEILTQSIKDVKYWEIREMLRRAGATSERDIHLSPNDLGTTQASHNQITSLHPQSTNGSKQCDDWLAKRRDSLMVVASLLATMAFQAGLTPPGGLWQDNFIGNGHELPAHSAGFPIMADFDRISYEIFMAYNSIGFMVSLTIILLLISGLPWFRRTFFMWILTVMMWVAIFAMALAYQLSISTLVTMHKSYLTELNVQSTWCYLLLLLLLLGHMIRLTVRMIKFLIKSVKKAIRRSSSTNGHEEQHHRV